MNVFEGIRKYANEELILMKLAWLPSMFTIFNLSSGIFSLLFATTGQYKIALLLIIFAAFYDVLDGLMARLMHCSSEFGKQLDSLADIISFGLAPAFLTLFDSLEQFDLLGPLAVVLFVICGALRLARFNLLAPAKGFVGMPITAAGLILSTLSLLDDRIRPELMLAVMGGLSVLMVSRISFPSFKKYL